MKKLYTVEVSYTVVVLAENEREAEKLAEEAGEGGCGVEMAPIVSPFRMPSGWDKDCLPFGDQDGDDELTIGELIAKGAV